MKKSFKEIVNRVNGFEVPIFGGGLSWNPPILDIEVARRLLTYLEDRRALYAPYECETAQYVERSILDIRKRLTSDLEQLDHDSPLAKSLIAMRAACRKFLDDVEGIDTDLMSYLHPRMWDRDERDFFMALGGLRSIIGIHAAQIAVRYGLDVDENLVQIFPIDPGDT
ncbi:MAG: hypothetical protein JW908_13845 [Anaerolineales bacterium]|nr:hypothetical protein [Anaerolineales bacterium]